MRIIAGKWRRRQIATVEGKGTRPILDRAKTILFDMLGHRLDEPGRLPQIAVLDLFAGSGALGLEALSRGAGYCLFVEKHHATAAMLRKNIAILGIVNEADIVKGNACNCEIQRPRGVVGTSGRYKLVFVDPPYRMLEGAVLRRDMRYLLERLANDPAIDPDAMIVVRHSLQGGEGPDLSPLIEQDRRNIGTMVLRFMSPGRLDAPNG